MPTAVLVGVGGTGAACLEAALHLAALGYFPGRWNSFLPICLDFDSAHPRIAGASAFVNSYRKVRGTKQLSEGLLGPVIQPLQLLRPASTPNLPGLLGLTPGSDSERIATLFLSRAILGEYGGQEYQNGLFGECIAGSCFFSSAQLRAELQQSTNAALTDPGSRVILFGSFFGGTGASGLLPSATHFKELAADAQRAIVELEPYFVPDQTEAEEIARRDSGPVNLPLSFGRRLQTAYHHQFEVGMHPTGRLYVVGTPNPVAYPRGWFERSQQDNPPHFVEYLGVAMAADFLEASVEGFRVGYIPKTPDAAVHRGDPAIGVRAALWTATVVKGVLAAIVEPAIKEAGRCKQYYLAGHPWLAETIEEMAGGGKEDESRQHHPRERTAMEHFISHTAGVSALLDMVLQRAGGDKDCAFWTDESRGEKRREVWARSFPRSFLPELDRLNLSQLLPRKEFDPLAFLRSYKRAHDDDAPLRALFRWASAVSSRLGEEWTRDEFSKRQRLLVRQGAPWRDAPGVQVAIGGDGPSLLFEKGDLLQHLANAVLDAPFNVDSERRASEFATLWGHTLAYRENVWRWTRMSNMTKEREQALLLHLGLLWVTLMQVDGANAPRLRWVPLESLPPNLGLAVKGTFPCGDFAHLYTSQEPGLLLLENPWESGSLLGVLFPSTMIVPSAELDGRTTRKLTELGRYGGEEFAGQLRGRFSRWQDLTTDWHTAGAGSPWPTLLAVFLQRAGTGIQGNTGTPVQLDTNQPPAPSGWLQAAFGK